MSTASSPALPDKPKRRGPLVAVVVVAVLVVAALVAFFALRGGDSATTAAGGEKRQVVRVGTDGAADPYWQVIKERAASELNVDLQLTNFTDYSQPNPALSQDQLDINQFQHIQYLANYNVTAKDDLQPIGSTAIYPLPLYSTEYQDAASIPDGATVAISNDAINQARGLLVLQSAGLLTLKDGGTPFSSTNDIVTKRVEVTAVDASQTANALQSGSAAAAVVNNNYATKAKLSTDDIIKADDPTSPASAPYVNLFVVRAEDKDDATYLKIAKIFHEEAVQTSFLQDYPQAIVQDLPAADLQASLVEVEDQARAAGVS